MRTSYHDIKAIVLTRIRENIWPPGANLPGEIELAKEFGCARATVNRAMRELVDEGILERHRSNERCRCADVEEESRRGACLVCDPRGGEGRTQRHETEPERKQRPEIGLFACGAGER